MAIEALTLALDGVIFNTEDLHLRACNTAFEHCGLGLRWSLQHLRGATRVHGATRVVSALIDKVSPSREDAMRLVQEKNRVFHELAIADGAVLNPAAMHLMEDALESGCKLAIVTDMPVQTATAVLDQAFGHVVTNMFAVILSGAEFNESAGNGPYHLALRTMGVEPANCVAIDASVPGLCAAQQAGIWTMAVTPYEKGIARITGADIWCPQLQELRHLIGKRRTAPMQSETFVTFDMLHAFKHDRQASMPVTSQAMQIRLAA